MTVELKPLAAGNGLATPSLLVNWSDAEEGSIHVVQSTLVSDEVSFALQVEFGKGRTEIDPSLVVTTTGSTPTEMACQHKVFWYGGYYWAFYDRGDKICYKNSADGLTWGSEIALPEGTALYTGYGFDVAGREGKVIVSWVDSGVTNCYAKTGVVVGSKILWNLRVSVTTLGACNAPVSVAIGTDESYYVFVQWRRNPYGWMWDVWRSFDGTTFGFAGGDYAFDVFTWNVICPFGNDGDIALVETTDSSTSVRVRYWIASFGGYEGWTPPTTYAVGMASGAKGDKFSAIATSDGTVHLAFKENSAGKLRYAVIYTGGVMSYWDITSTAISGYPSICLDANNDLHIFYLTVESGKYVIRHTQKLSVYTSDWSAPDVFYAYSTTAVVKGLTSWNEPVGTHALLWTESNTQVKFGSIPIPYGTAGAQSDPWNRDGLSPYGTYFSTHGDYISPGSGLLTLTETDVSIPGRAGLDLGISRLYMQPRYFRLSDGTAYLPSAYPYCNLGPRWSLDLPWMDKNYIGIPGGQRFIIMWGNTGDPDVFENHDGVHFTLRERIQSTPHGPLQYYELVMASGIRYVFDYGNYKLVEISDLRGYDIDSSSYTDSYNIIWINYDYTNNRISSIEESDLGRIISFTYDGNGNLWKITRPDTKTITFLYTNYGGTYYLTSVTDPQNRVTSFTWSALGTSPVNYLITRVTFPTGGVNDYLYTVDNTPATEVRSWLVTTAKVQSSASGPLIRQTDFDYKVVNGRATFCKATERNEAGAIQGYTEYIFQSALKYTSETKKDSAGAQLSRSDTWYDSVGQPVRFDTFKGASQSITYSEYTGYDDWGNVIFTRDALGHESYSSYANTQTKNSFQGGSLLTRTTPGKIFYDAFDDWDFSDWTVYTTGGAVVLLDAGSDPPNAPTLTVRRGDSPSDCVVTHSIPAYSGDFVMQLSWWTSSFETCYILGMSGTSTILNFTAYATNFRYWTGSSWQPVGTYEYRKWYDIGFVVHRTAGQSNYDIYIDGVKVWTAAPLLGTGSVDSIRIREGNSGDGAATTNIDNIRLYKSLTVTVTGASGYIAELYDSKGKILDRSKSGTLNVPAVPLNFPPGHIKIAKEGYSSFETPVMDIWGGDVYSMSAGYSSSSLPKTSTGYLKTWGTINDENPFPGTTISNGDLTWVNDPDYAASGSWYHESAYYTWGSHYHGFDGASGVSVYTTHVLTQYVWLTEGKVPQEIAVQFNIAGVWKRAYWGGTSSIVDFDTYVPNQILRIGDVPQTTGKWLELTVLASDLGITGTSYVYGVLYGLYSGTARWDFTAQYSRGLNIYGLTQGQQVELYLDDDTYIYGVEDTAQPVILDLYGNYERVFPVSGYFKILSTTSTLLYESPWFSEIWNLDIFTYSASEFYANEVKWLIRDHPVGSFQYQDSGKTVEQKSYTSYDNEGNAIMTKAKLGSGWVYARAGYDEYGNMLWSTDPTGRETVTEYSVADLWTYPKSTRQGLRIDTFDTDNSWTTTPGSPSWISSAYSSARSYSPDRSIREWFSGAPQGSDSGAASVTKEFASAGGPVQELSVWMYLESWYHDSVVGWRNLMDTGIRMRLYDSSNANYATYTYWLACWDQNNADPNNRSAPDAYTKVVYGIGDVPMGTWKKVMLYPSTDWPSIDWSSCAKIKFELYVYSGYAYQDYLTLYYDNFAYNDFAKNAKTTYSYHLPTGNLLSTTDPLGRTVSQQYDNIGRVIRANNSGDGSYRSMTYDDANNKVTVLDELGHKTVSYFDKIGRNWKVERFAGASANYSWTKYTYNWQDQVSSYKDARGHITTSTYDYLGRVTKVTYPDLHYATTTYDDIQNRVTYESWNVSSGAVTHRLVKVFDNLGRLNDTAEFKDASTTFDTAYHTLMTYDAAGNLLTVKDARSGLRQVTRMTYDSLNRLVKNTYPDGYTDNVSYDNAGRVICKMDREGNLTFTTYDSAGNVAKFASPNDIMFYKYDAAGQRTEVRNTLGVITYGYNLRGMMNSLSQVVFGSNTYALSFGYDAENKMTSITYPDATVNYYYDWLDRVRDVKKGTTQILNITYNTDDTIATEKTGESSSNYVKTTTYTYTNRDWVDTIVMKRKTTTKLSLDYNYDDVGNVVRLTDVLNSKIERYTYDWLDRLTSASGGYLPSGLTYTYDAVGNRLTCGSTSYNYGINNKLTSDSTWTYSYDVNGNLAHKTKTGETWDYTFNSLDQLTAVVKSGTTLGQYKYDANGMRANTTVGTTPTYTDFVYFGHDPLYERSKTGSTKTTTDYVYVNGRLKFTLVGSNTYYYFTDALGSVRQIWQYGSSTSASFSAQTYKPFGTPVGVSGTDQKWKYAGEMLDSATGLYYIGARYMDPELGRFVSLDPQLGKLSMPQSMNRYVYCVNNPLRFTDPTGQWFWVAIGAAVGAVVNTAIYLATTDNPTLEGALLAAASGAITGAVAAATFGVGTIAGRAISGAVSGGVSMAVYAGAQIAAGQEITAQGLAAAGAGGFVAGFIGGGKQVTSLLSIKSLGAKASTFAWQKAGIRLLGNEAMLAGIGARFAVKGALGVTGALVGAGVSMATGDPNKPGMSDRTLGWSYVGSGLGGLGSDPWAGAPMSGTRASVEAGAWQLIGGFVKVLGTLPTYR